MGGQHRSAQGLGRKPGPFGARAAYEVTAQAQAQIGIPPPDGGRHGPGGLEQGTAPAVHLQVLPAQALAHTVLQCGLQLGLNPRRRLI